MASRTDRVVQMVQFQCTEPKENLEIDKVFEVIMAAVKGELESGDGKSVVRCLIAGIRLANVSALMMGMSKDGVYDCVAHTLKMHLASANKNLEDLS